MQKRNRIALIGFAIFYIAFGLLLTFKQEALIYQPWPQDFLACTALDTAEKITFNGTRLYVKDTHLPTAVLYHGNAGAACDRAWYTELFRAAGYGYVLVEYAGYSNDARAPSHQLILADVKNVIAFLSDRQVTKVAVVGESIGTGPAAYHASLAAPQKLLLILPFTNLAALAKNQFWFYPTSLLVDNAYDNVSALTNYEGEVQIIHGEKDTLIPLSQAQALYDSLGTKKAIHIVSGVGHNDLFMDQTASERIIQFLLE